jgi:hypothetical protein
MNKQQAETFLQNFNKKMAEYDAAIDPKSITEFCEQLQNIPDDEDDLIKALNRWRRTR